MFPPTYDGAIYATERRRTAEGAVVDCVLLDSVQSQANRLEAALLAAYDRGEVRFPLMAVDFSSRVDGIGRITALDAPHRIADAIFRDSLLGGVAFRQSDAGRAFEKSSVADATALLMLCPTALVFGTWDSTGAAGGLGNKFARALTSEIVGYGVELGVRTSSRIDPLRIEKLVDIFRASAGGWTLDPALAARDKKGEPVKLKPSDVNHGNVTPDIVRDGHKEPIAGGITMLHAQQTVVLSLAGLRKLRFPSAGASVEARVSRARAAWTALGALALAAVVHQHSDGFDLRSRCALVPEAAPVFEEVLPDGAVRGFTLTPDEANSLLARAAEVLGRVGLPWRGEEIVLEPNPDLVTLLQRGRALAGAE
ncbi:type I-U CRISPR-associated RAMP protein Csb1/Cas7u [Myxococcota bacterium]|nr:type I-U CRISPR-associated RAMP protein Csb1/Cas7u [Myxococcota bacterium]